MTLLILIIAVLAGAFLFLKLRSNRSGGAPPGTVGLDEETAVRPEIDPAALAAARARVSPAVPDEVLSDALLDATPKQLASLFAAVPKDVMAAALGKEAEAPRGQAKAEDLAQLRKMGDAVDDLEIWSFGEKS
ncbi:hypothetical protein [Deinococcus sp. YIM 77859]|uniref:hypothetical protein n=1 Tax=Deinococcus sp. YIM 77859 TaxID=1540221 RepID=UPI000556F16B|nr:hypothetical protein [Deinococcus sp. YIM 77859]